MHSLKYFTLLTLLQFTLSFAAYGRLSFWLKDKFNLLHHAITRFSVVRTYFLPTTIFRAYPIRLAAIHTATTGACHTLFSPSFKPPVTTVIPVWISLQPL